VVDANRPDEVADKWVVRWTQAAMTEQHEMAPKKLRMELRKERVHWAIDCMEDKVKQDATC
jgi:hypothetical protein